MKAMSMSTAKTGKKSGAQSKAGAKAMSRDGMLARIEAVRLEQRQAGHFDCFAKAGSGYCDQGHCAYRGDCLAISARMA